MKPFTYPSAPLVRRHGPRGYADYASYRPFLRDEFQFRCVYCLLREQWGRARGVFDLDHFLPVATHPDRSRTYDNLVYCCARCNEIKRDRVVPDPCRFLLNGEITVLRDGTLVTRGPEARRLVQKLGLAEREATEFRLLWIGILELAERYDPPLFERLMGYPEDLPDLSKLRPPGGNSRPAGVATSYYAQRKAGTLPPVY